MTKQELNMILKLIDLHTSTSDIMQTNGKIMFENSIVDLKKDIKELFEEKNNNNE